jgi:putative hemolysin
MTGDDGFLLELALIAVLILLNGFFASAEMAIVSARRPRLQALLEAGRRHAGAVLRLKSDPDRFLATVQIGVTVVGTLASAVAGVAAIERLEPVFSAIDVPWIRNAAEPLAVGVVVSVIAYLSLVVGELVPKALAVRNAESLAMLTARTIEVLSRVVRPLVSVLTASSRLLLRLLGQGATHVQSFHTLDDLRAMAEEASQQGVVAGDVMRGAVEFHERQVREVVTPRRRIKALSVRASLQDALRLIGDTGHSRFPVYDQGVDDVLGFVYARDVYETALRGQELDLDRLRRPLLTVPGTKPATALLSEMQKGRTQMALVIDEHGGIEGLLTIEDLVEVIVGEIHDEHETPAEPPRALAEGAWEADGGTPVHEINADARLKLPESSDYVTIGGLVLERLGTIPCGGETVDVPPYRITVLAVEGHRVARVRIEVAAGSG